MMTNLKVVKSLLLGALVATLSRKSLALPNRTAVDSTPQLARRRLIENNAKGQPISAEHWIASVEDMDEETCQTLDDEISRVCHGASDQSSAATDFNANIQSAFDDLCIIEFTCSEKLVFQGALDHLVEPENLERATSHLAFDHHHDNLSGDMTDDLDDGRRDTSGTDIGTRTDTESDLASLAPGKGNIKSLNVTDPTIKLKRSELKALFGEGGLNKGWNLERISQANPMKYRSPIASQFAPRYGGVGVNIYIIDTGVKADHDDFQHHDMLQAGGSRVVMGLNAIQNETNDDISGHGTHCAGTAAGNTYGSAHNATIISVKAANAQGSLETGSLVRSLKWAVTQQKQKYKGQAAVFSISLRTMPSKAIDAATKKAAKAGHIVVVAAGNDISDSCYFSPQRMGGKAKERSIDVINVMASDYNDDLSSFSNFGTCADIIAPGSDILSAGITSHNASRISSGTSMATPLVAGVAAQLLQKHSFDKRKAQKELFDIALPGYIKFQLNAIVSGTPNLLLQMPMY